MTFFELGFDANGDICELSIVDRPSNPQLQADIMKKLIRRYVLMNDEERIKR